MGATAIMVDSREPAWVQGLTFGGVPRTITPLDEGDCLVATESNDLLLIERKTPADLLGSIKDGRIFVQAAAMASKTRWSYVVITGGLQHGAGGALITDRGQTGWSFASVTGALLAIQELGVFVTFSAGDTDYEHCVLRLANRDRSKETRLEPVKAALILSVQEQVVASLPGVGAERARTVLDAAGGSPAVAISLLSDRSSVWPGINEGVKRMVRNALKLAENELLIVTSNSDGQEVVEIVKEH